MILKIISLILPWSLRRILLQKWFGFTIHPTARIRFAWIFPQELIMEEFSRIDHFTVAIHLDKIVMKKNTSIGRSNWITGFSSKINSKHFEHQKNRISELILGESSAITKNHHIDCTSSINIGKFVTIAGYNSQFLSHSIDVYENRQDSLPITIGDYCFVGTNVVILGGAFLPSYSVLGAKSLLNKSFTEEWMLYGGVPSKPIVTISKQAKYFKRSKGYVN